MAADIKTIGRYEVLGVLGRGAMGVVYKAVDPVIDRTVAIKTIKLSLSEEELAFYEARFSQEIKTVGKLNHPNIVTIFDVGRTDEFAYMAMEFIDGPELKMLMAPGKPLDTATSIDLVAQVADGLALAHSRGIIHRDVKPSNVMLAFDEDHMIAKVTDFGIARGQTSAVKTMTGMILGSPRYMSPEHVTGKNLDARSDVFSLGVVLYEMLAGAAPFDADSVSSIMYKTVHEPEAPLTRFNDAVPEEVARVIARAMAKTPDERFATMKEFGRALRELARTLPVPQPRLEIATPSPSAPGSFSGLAPTADTAPGGLSVSLDFDSLAATLRLVKMTEPTLDTTRIVLPQPAAMAQTPPPPKQHAPEPVAVVATPAAPPAQKPAPPVAKPVLPAPVTQPFPVGPAALLGTLAVVAIALGVALAF